MMPRRPITSNTLFYGPVAEILVGRAAVKMPPESGTFKQAQRVQLPEGDQLGLDGL